MAQSCMSTEELVIKTEMPLSTVKNVITLRALPLEIEGNLFRRRRDGSKSHRLAVDVAVPLQRFRRRLQGVPPFVVVAAPAGREHIVQIVSIFSAPYGEKMVYLHICIGKITPTVDAMPAEFVVDGAVFHRRQLPPCAHCSISARRPSLI